MFSIRSRVSLPQYFTFLLLRWKCLLHSCMAARCSPHNLIASTCFPGLSPLRCGSLLRFIAFALQHRINISFAWSLTQFVRESCSSMNITFSPPFLFQYHFGVIWEAFCVLGYRQNVVRKSFCVYRYRERIFFSFVWVWHIFLHRLASVRGGLF